LQLPRSHRPGPSARIGVRNSACPENASFAAVTGWLFNS
jgi:hypothetical protein